jgi:hypothetical protein
VAVKCGNCVCLSEVERRNCELFGKEYLKANIWTGERQRVRDRDRERYRAVGK